MKKILFLLFLAIGFSSHAQKLKEYKASNNVVYKKGDVIKMNKGSAENGDFVYLSIGGWAAGTGQKIPATYAGVAVKIKKIKKYKKHGVEKVLFTVNGGNITNYILDIEPAISSCEVTPCSQKKATTKSESKYDKLKKLKELLDSGAITKEEFEKEKKKILKEQ
jgi:hypothetical protein